jgi:Ulp1 family protease
MLFSGLDNKARTGFASLFSFSKSFFPEDGIGKGAGASAGGPSLISLQRPLDSSTSSSLLSLQKPEPSSPLFHNHSHESSTMLDDVANETMDESESTLTNSLAKLSLRRTEETFRSTVYRSYQQGLANEIEEAKNSLMLLQNGPTSTIPFRPVPPLRRTLTQEEMKLVNNALSLSGSEKEIIVKGHKVEITKKDMRTLRDNGWLNDEIVNMVSNLVKDFLEMPPYDIDLLGKGLLSD